MHSRFGLTLATVALLAIGALADTSTSTGGDTHTVQPGQTHTNGDDVEVRNTAPAAGGNATVTPKAGTETAETTVKTKMGFQGSIKRIDSNDKVKIGSTNVATVEGTGGEVTIGGGSTVTVRTGAGSIIVRLNSGTTVTVGPHSEATFAT